MESESYYEIVAENTRTGDVEKRIVRAGLGKDVLDIRHKAISIVEQLHKAGFNLIQSRYVETKVTHLEWLSHGDA